MDDGNHARVVEEATRQIRPHDQRARCQRKAGMGKGEVEKRDVRRGKQVATHR